MGDNNVVRRISMQRVCLPTDSTTCSLSYQLKWHVHFSFFFSVAVESIFVFVRLIVSVLSNSLLSSSLSRQRLSLSPTWDASISCQWQTCHPFCPYTAPRMGIRVLVNWCVRRMILLLPPCNDFEEPRQRVHERVMIDQVHSNFIAQIEHRYAKYQRRISRCSRSIHGSSGF